MTEHAAPPMPQPTAEHKLLQDLVGNWKVACKFYMDPSQPPMETNATEKVDLIGDFWTVSRFETQMMGAPFVGCGIGGADSSFFMCSPSLSGDSRGRRSPRRRATG